MIDSVTIEIQFDIQASQQRVWEAVVAETTNWWRKEFFATKNPQGIYLEPQAGGRLYEQAEGDAGLLWYTVTEVLPPSILGMAGHLAPPYGGPATSMFRLELTEKGGGSCQVKLSDHIFGVVTPKTKDVIESGWRTLFVDGLKPYCEQ